MALNSAQQGALKALTREPGWDVLVRFMAARVDKMNAEQIGGVDAFETLRALHRREGATAALVQLFDDVERKAFEA